MLGRYLLKQIFLQTLTLYVPRPNQLPVSFNLTKLFFVPQHDKTTTIS